MLDQLAQAHAARVRTHRHPEPRRQQQDRHDLVDAAEPAGVDLADADGAGLEQLLEHDPVVDVLAGGDPDGRDAPGDGRVAQDVVRAGGLLDPVRVERRPAGPSTRWRCRRPSAGWRPPRACGPGRVLASGSAHPPDVVLDVGADLHLEPRPAVGQRLAGRAGDLVVVVAQPADGRRVGRVAVRRSSALALGSTGHRPPRGSRAPSSRRQRIGQVAEVDQGDELLAATCPRAAARRGLPARFATRSQTALTTAAVARWMTPFSGPEPAQLAVADERPARTRPRSRSSRLHVAGRRPAARAARTAATTDLRPAPDREREAVALEAVAGVGAQDHVGRRVVRVRVHGVGAVERRARSGSGRRRPRADVVIARRRQVRHPFSAPTRRPRVMYRSRSDRHDHDRARS